MELYRELLNRSFTSSRYILYICTEVIIIAYVFFKYSFKLGKSAFIYDCVYSFRKEKPKGTVPSVCLILRFTWKSYETF